MNGCKTLGRFTLPVLYVDKNSDAIYMNINVNDGFIYYTNYSDNEYIYKIRTDGSGKIKLNKKRVIVLTFFVIEFIIVNMKMENIIK
jgi:hypothetical protein